ncbi:MAG: DUF47 family protein [Actinomycetota bacterium]
MTTRIRRAIAALTERIAPRVPDFHGLLEEQCAVMVEALDALVAYTGDGAPEHGERVRALEKEGDRRRARTLDTLARAFATPMDRGAIHLAATAIDDVLNYAKTTVREIEILEVPPDPWMRRLAEQLREGGVSLREGFARLHDDPAAAQAAALTVHKSERSAEKVYRAAVADAFAAERYAAASSGQGDGGAPQLEALLLALRRREVYRHLSNAADRLDAAGRLLLGIVLADV